MQEKFSNKNFSWESNRLLHGFTNIDASTTSDVEPSTFCCH